jgi:hypothetical protein
MINIYKMQYSRKFISLRDLIIQILYDLRMYSAPKVVSTLLLNFAKMEI